MLDVVHPHLLPLLLQLDLRLLLLLIHRRNEGAWPLDFIQIKTIQIWQLWRDILSHLIALLLIWLLSQLPIFISVEFGEFDLRVGYHSSLCGWHPILSISDES